MRSQVQVLSPRIFKPIIFKSLRESRKPSAGSLFPVGRIVCAEGCFCPELLTPTISDSFITISAGQLQINSEIILTYDLPISVEIETTDGVDYEITWRGDEIIAICPNVDIYPFYRSGGDCQ